MKMRMAMGILMLWACAVPTANLRAQGAAFTYQGRLNDNSAPASGLYDLQFTLYDALTGGRVAGGPLTNAPVGVSNGLFTVTLDFGALVFDGSDRWLEVGVRPGASASDFTSLAPRQKLAATPYAIRAANFSGALAASQITGTISPNNIANGAITANMLAPGSVGATQIAPGAISGDLWSAMNLTGAPSLRFDHTAIWTGSEMIIWGGYAGNPLKDGARYNPALNTWTAVNTAAPVARSQHTAVWTGTEMIVWGGAGTSNLNDGGRYNPISNSWIPINTNGAPSGRQHHRAVWTGSEMIVWGGGIGGGIQGVTKFNDGGRYNPTSDSWSATIASGAPTARYLHTAIWTGREMIVWGGAGPGLPERRRPLQPVLQYLDGHQPRWRPRCAR